MTSIPTLTAQFYDGPPASGGPTGNLVATVVVAAKSYSVKNSLPITSGSITFVGPARIASGTVTIA